MHAPAEGGFASNVNVMVQQSSLSLKAYRDLSLRHEAACVRLGAVADEALDGFALRRGELVGIESARECDAG